MEHRIGVTGVLWVDNYEKAIFFYCDQTKLFSLYANTSGVGLRNVVLSYNLPGAPFYLVLHLAQTPAMTDLVGRQGGDHALFILPVADCQDIYARLKGTSLSFTGEPVSLPYGCQVTLLDPFGNKVCLSERY